MNSSSIYSIYQTYLGFHASWLSLILMCSNPAKAQYRLISPIWCSLLLLHCLIYHKYGWIWIHSAQIMGIKFCMATMAFAIKLHDEITTITRKVCRNLDKCFWVFKGIFLLNKTYPYFYVPVWIHTGVDIRFLWFKPFQMEEEC